MSTNAMQRMIDQLRAEVRQSQVDISALRAGAVRGASWVRFSTDADVAWFVLTSNPAGGATGSTGAPMTATATVYQADHTTVIESGVTLYLSFDRFKDLVAGDFGECAKDIRGTWWAIGTPHEASSSVYFTTFTLTADLASGTGQTATATVDTSNDPGLIAGATITVVNTGAKRSYSTSKGLAAKVGSAWWIVEIDQFAMLWRGTLAKSTHSFSISGTNIPGSVASQQPLQLSAGEALTPYPFAYLPPISYVEPTYTGPVITNPHNFIGLNGDKVLIAHIRSTGTNEIIDVFPAETRELLYEMTADAPNGLQPSVAAKGYANLGRGELPATFTVKDNFFAAHNGKIGDKGYAIWDFALSAYLVVASEHDATVVKASLSAAFSGTPLDFTVSSLTGMNGWTPADSILTVKNRYSWEAGTAGYIIEIKWDPIAGEWYPAQMRCPL